MTTVTVAAGIPRPSKLGAVIRVTSGNFLEQFDFFLFGFYATYISKTFFPSHSEFASLMLTFSVFGAGFLMRPLGAIVLGGYIDKVGRRKGLIVTLAIMASGTMLIAFVPGYATHRPARPAAGAHGRLLQGFSAGAELGGVSVYLAEMATPGHRGFYTSWQSASQQVAIVVAAALGYAINSWMSVDDITAWGWRIPFFIGCIDRAVHFHAPPLAGWRPKSSWRASTIPTRARFFRPMVTNWAVVLEWMLLVAMTTTTFYLITVYTPTFGRSVLKLSAADSLIVTLCVGITNFIWLPVGGALSDRIGRRPILIAITVLAILTAYPLLWWLATAPSFQRLLLVLLLFSFYFGMYNGAMVVTLTEVMPPAERVVGFSLAFSLATAVFGGMTPAVSTYLIEVTGDRAAPGYWMSLAAACSLAATLLLLRRERRARAT